MAEQKILRKRLANHLKGGEASMPISEVLEKITFEDLNTRPYSLPYSFYELFFHIVFTQKDIVKFTCSEDYTAPKWPDYYWPKEKACKNREAWEHLKSDYFSDRERLQKFILDEANVLDKPVKNAKKEEQTLLREILLVIEHTAYHTGQLIVLLRLLNLH